MSTPVRTNEYGFSHYERNAQQIAYTNASTRTQLFREMVVATDANGNSFIGFVANVEGILAGASGQIDLEEGDTVTTEQATLPDAGFVVGDSNVFVVPQTNVIPAAIVSASVAGAFQLKALIVAVNSVAGGYIRLRMPTQDGNIIAVV